MQQLKDAQWIDANTIRSFAAFDVVVLSVVASPRLGHAAAANRTHATLKAKSVRQDVACPARQHQGVFGIRVAATR